MDSAVLGSPFKAGWEIHSRVSPTPPLRAADLAGGWALSFIFIPRGFWLLPVGYWYAAVRCSGFCPGSGPLARKKGLLQDRNDLFQAGCLHITAEQVVKQGARLLIGFLISLAIISLAIQRALNVSGHGSAQAAFTARGFLLNPLDHLHRQPDFQPDFADALSLLPTAPVALS